MFFFIRWATSELSPPIAVKLCHIIAIWAFFINNASPKIRGPSPKEIGGQKHAKIRHDFRQLQTSIANISGTGQDIQNRKDAITSDSSRVERKKSDELWSTNYRELYVSLKPPKCNFCETIFRPLGGWLAPQILTRTTDWPRLASAHPNGDGGPPKNLRANVKLGLKFSVLAPITLGIVGVTSRNFHATYARQGCSRGSYFWVDPPLKFGRAKKRLKFGAISDNYRVRSRISPERIHISKIEKVVDQLQPLPRWAKKVGEIWSTNKKVIGANVDPPELNFSRDYISARSGCWPLKFLHTLEIDQGLLAHTPGGLTLGSVPYF